MPVSKDVFPGVSVEEMHLIRDKLREMFHKKTIQPEPWENQIDNPGRWIC